ncbi:MAG TPA: hypothetical protein VG297_21325 [Bryobacteraceae bacterium]|nr:hypothetical protein [Bryobacteraceae bacterium]
MALASALLAPAVSHAQISCTREGLKAAADLSIAAQAHGYERLTQEYTTGSGIAAGGFLVGLPVSRRMSYVENFDTSSRSRLIDKPLKIDRHLSLLDTARCETYTEGLVSDKADPYALGTRLHLGNARVTEMETMWSAPGYRGFDIDGYLRNSSAEDWGAIPAAGRDTRATLESAANAYLDALLAGKADVMPWGFPCDRTAADGSCQAGVPAGTVNISNRHFVVDETIGAVAVLCTFGVAPVSGRIRTPDAHLFRVENGKVRFVHAVTHFPDAADGSAISDQAKAPAPVKGPAPQN